MANKQTEKGSKKKETKNKRIFCFKRSLISSQTRALNKHKLLSLKNTKKKIQKN